jgi:diacylglycerol kinase
MRSFIKSVVHALSGVRYTFGNERNFQLEAIVAIGVILLMMLLPVTLQEKTTLVMVIVSILVLELINTAVERVVDMLKPRVHPFARIAKDVMAAAVLIASLGAVCVGLIIFLPYLLKIV